MIQNHYRQSTPLHADLIVSSECSLYQVWTKSNVSVNCTNNTFELYHLSAARKQGDKMHLVQLTSHQITALEAL